MAEAGKDWGLLMSLLPITQPTAVLGQRDVEAGGHNVSTKPCVQAVLMHGPSPTGLVRPCKPRASQTGREQGRDIPITLQSP